MASIKERAAALKLAEKLCAGPRAHVVATKPVQSSSMWSGLIAHLKANVTVKRRRVHLKSHGDCFLGSEAVDVLEEHIGRLKVFEGGGVSRDRLASVCQVLLDRGVFEAVGTGGVFGKVKKRDAFQDSKSALYRFVGGCSPSVDELERVALVNEIQGLFCSAPSDGQEEQTCPAVSHLQMSTPVRFTPTSTEADRLDAPAAAVSPGLLVDGPSPSRVQADSALSQSMVDEVWQELTLLRLLDLVELPLLEGVLQCSCAPSPPSPVNLLAHSNPDLIYSSNHLDRQILKAFRDSQEDEWLRAALDCLDFLPDQPVVELSRELPHCFPQDPDPGPGSQDGATSPGSAADVYTGEEHPRLSQSGSAQCKLLLHATLVKHYGHADRPPLLPEHMTDIFTAVTDLLVNAKLAVALEAVQMSLKLLPPGRRDELHKLLTFMALAADPQEIRLEREVENRHAVKRSFSRAILHSRVLPKENEDLMVAFMLSNVKDVFKIPPTLHKRVSDKLASLGRSKQPDVTASGFTFCQQVPGGTNVDFTKTTTYKELWALLDGIHQDTRIAAKEKRRLLGQFYAAHPEIFQQYFGESAANVL